MTSENIRAAILAGTHRVRTYRTLRDRTSYNLEKLNAKHGWLPVAAHANAVRHAIKGLPHRYDMTLGVVYDSQSLAA